MEDQELNDSSVGSLLPNQTAGTLAIYNSAKKALGKHITLNEMVPHDVGCAEAVSYVLKDAGFAMPKLGIPGTANLYQWLKNSPNFKQRFIGDAIPGSIIISPTGTSALNSPHGHTGIVGKYGILSNDSATGLFLEFWNLDKWKRYYNQQLAFPVFIFIPL